MAVAVPPEAAAGVPPHNEEAEASVLGAILLTEQALDGVLLEVGLRAHDFYRPRHQVIFQAMIRLKEKAAPEAVDALTVSEDLRRSGDLEKAGGEGYLHSLPTVVPAVGAVLDYARIVKEHSLLRSILSATREIQDDVASHNGEARELIERAEAVLFKIGHDGGTSEMRSLEAILHDEIDKLEELSKTRRRAHRHALRLCRPRRAHRRIPARQPDRARRSPLDGKERGRHEHRRVRGRGGRRPGGAVLARDVRDRARAPLPGVPGARVERRPAQGPRSRGEVAEGAEGGREARPRADLRGRLERHERARAAREVAPAGRPPRPRPGRRGLPPADAARGPAGQQPRRADRPDQPRTQDPRARARGAGDRRLAALPRGRVTQPARADAVGPSRIGLPDRRVTHLPPEHGRVSTDRGARRDVWLRGACASTARPGSSSAERSHEPSQPAASLSTDSRRSSGARSARPATTSSSHSTGGSASTRSRWENTWPCPERCRARTVQCDDVAG